MLKYIIGYQQAYYGRYTGIYFQISTVSNGTINTVTIANISNLIANLQDKITVP